MHAIKLLSVVAVIVTSRVVAADRVWPSTSGDPACSNTLQTCIDEAEYGDRIRLRPNYAIDESVVIKDKGLRLVGEPGHAVRFAPGRGLLIDYKPLIVGPLPPPGFVPEIEIANVKFKDANIVIAEPTDQMTFIFDHVTVDTRGINAPAGAGAIEMDFTPNITSSYNLRLIIRRSELTNANGNHALRVQSGKHSIDLHIEDNQFNSTRDGVDCGSVMKLVLGGDRSRLDFIRNRLRMVETPTDDALLCELGASIIQTQGLTTGRISDNVFSSESTALRLVSTFGKLETLVVNNTLITSDPSQSVVDVIDASPDKSAIFGRFANNLVVGGHATFSVNPFFERTTNMYQGLHTTTPIEASEQRVEDIRFTADLRLAPGSPAIDAGNSLLRDNPTTFALSPSIMADADGLRRIRGSAAVDIGAFEHGDESFAVIHNSDTANWRLDLTDGNLDGVVASAPQVRKWQPAAESQAGYPGGVTSFFDVGSGHWQVGLEGGGMIQPGQGFAVLAARGGPNVGTHTVTASNLYLGDGTTLAQPFASLSADSIFLVTRTRLLDSSTATPFTLAVQHVGNAWRIRNTNGAHMPLGAQFHVYAQPPTANAFSVTADAQSNIVGTGQLWVDHPALNGHPCASVQVTVNDLAVQYEPTLRFRADATPGGGWTIANDTGVVDHGDKFFVVIDPRVTEDHCLGTIFRNGFE